MSRALLCSVLLAVAGAGVARAEIESDLVKAGVAAYNDLEYPKALQLLRKALKETLTRDEKVATYRTLGFCHVALGDPAAARKDFENLLRTDRSYQLDRTASPSVRALFEQARSGLATGTATVVAPVRAPVELTAELRPPQPKSDQALTLSVYYPGGVAVALELFYRTRGQATFSKITGEGHLGRFEVIVPGMQVAVPGLEYYLVALDESGAPVAGAGSLAQPLTVEVASSARPIYKRGAFWGTIGILAIAGAVAGVVVFLVTRPATVTVVPQ